MINYIDTSKELNYKAIKNVNDESNTHDIAIHFDKRVILKVMNRLSFFHFSNLKKYIPLLKSRDEFLKEPWLNIYNRTIRATVPRSMNSASLTANETLMILERYFADVAKQIKTKSILQSQDLTRLVLPHCLHFIGT